MILWNQALGNNWDTNKLAPSKEETGVSKPEKLSEGIIQIMAEPKIAATCEVAKQDTNNPKEVATQAAQNAPKNRALKEPLIGTCKA